MPDAPLRQSSITVGGNFNPLILQPHWLLSQGLVAELDYKEAIKSSGHLLTPDFVRGEYAQLRFDALRDELAVSTVETSQSPALIRDFAVGLLQVLPHTPVDEIEIEHSIHSRTSDAQAILGRFVSTSPLRSVLDKPEVDSVLIVSAISPEGTVEVAIETSELDRFDLYVGIALNIERPDEAKDDSAAWAVAELGRRWQYSLDLAHEMFDLIYQPA